MDAKKIIRLLADKHGKDVFVPECKTGPSVGTTYHRIDAWVMAKSWANPMVTGYEVKISRSDFMGDKKWHQYLDYCNVLYFVVPHGLIDVSEVPDPAGLMVVSKTGTRITVKKKAGYRDVIIPDPLYRYILMCRTKIDADPGSSFGNGDSRDYWVRWLESKKFDFDFGRRVGKAIRDEIRDKISSVDSENKELKRINQSLSDVKRFLERGGIDPNSYWITERSIEDKKAALGRVVHLQTEIHLERLIGNLQDMQKRIEKEKELLSRPTDVDSAGKGGGDAD